MVTTVGRAQFWTSLGHNVHEVHDPEGAWAVWSLLRVKGVRKGSVPCQKTHALLL